MHNLMSEPSFLCIMVCSLQAAEDLVKEKPELAELIEPKISELCQQFDELERRPPKRKGRDFLMQIVKFCFIRPVMT